MSGIEVRGGAGGLSVRLEELEEAARALRALARDLLEVGHALAQAAADPALLGAGALAPTELAAAEGALLEIAGPGGAVGGSAQLLATAVVTDLAADAYRAGEDAVEHLSDAAATAMGVWIGTMVGAAAGGFAAPALGVGVAAAPLAGAVIARPGGGEDVGRGTDAAGVDVATGSVADLGGSVVDSLGAEVDGVLFDQPWIVPAAADGLDGFVTGLGLGLPPLGVWLGARAAGAGVPYPPRTREEAIGVVLASGTGLLDESNAGVRVRARAPRRGRAPRSVADLVADSGPTSGHGRVRVTGIPQPDGRWRWIVDVPGTQTFDPRAGRNPWDLTSSVLLSAGRPSLTSRAVTAALDDAQRRAGDGQGGPVMVAGHSQGGLTAAALAADPDFRARFDVTHVVTSGAPIGSLPVPEGVSVLSLEHREDLVPGLDGAENPDRADWVTVHRSLEDELGVEGRSTGAHRAQAYTETARMVDASEHPSVLAWREGAAPFLGEPASLLDPAGGGPPSPAAPDGPGVVVIDYDIERVPG